MKVRATYSFRPWTNLYGLGNVEQFQSMELVLLTASKSDVTTDFKWVEQCEEDANRARTELLG